MKNKYLIRGNKRSIKTESNYKIKHNKKQRNVEKIIYSKKITFEKYLLNKNIKISNNNKKKSNPKFSYNKRYNFPLITINNKIKRKEKKKDLIISYNIMDIQIQEQNEKEKIIEQLLCLKDDMQEQNLQLNLLKFYYNKL